MTNTALTNTALTNTAQQRSPHIPPRRTDDDVLRLAEELGRLGDAGDLVTAFLEEHLGLTHRQLRLLTHVAQTPRPATTPGEQDMFEALADSGMVEQVEGEAFIVTERGRVVLDQIEAVRIRLADRLVNEVGSEHAGSVRTLVQQMVQAIPAPARSSV